MSRTKWSSALEVWSPEYDGSGVKDLIEIRIKPDRLDENDLNALEAWADVLATNNSLSALQATEDLCQFIASYYPENERTTQRLYFAYKSAKNSEQRARECGDSFAQIIRSWLIKDPVQFASLTWATQFTDVFPLHEKEALITEAIEKQPRESQDQKGSGSARRRNGAYYYLMGTVFYTASDYFQAAKNFEQACARSPKESVYYNYLGISHFNQKQFKNAKENYEAAVRFDRDRAIYHSNLALALRELKMWPQAVIECDKAIEKEPENPYHKKIKATVFNAEGNDFYNKGDYPASLKDYEKAVELDRKTAMYHANLAVGLAGLKEWQRAIAAVEKIKEFGLDNVLYTQRLALIYNTRGNDYYEKKEYGASLKDYEKAVELDSKTTVYQANLALGLAGLKDWQRAIEAVEKIKDLEPDNVLYTQRLAGIYNTRGNDYYEKKDYAASLKDYEKAIKLDPKTNVYQTNLAVALSGLKEWQRAIEAVEKIKDLEPDNVLYTQRLALIYNTRGNDYYDKKDYAASIKDYEKAIELDSKTTVYHANLAGAFVTWEKLKGLEPQGEALNKALSALRKALELDPENGKYREGIEVLENLKTTEVRNLR